MRREDHVDEEIKKKKRQVLVVLFGLLVTGSMAGPLLPDSPPPASTPPMGATGTATWTPGGVPSATPTVEATPTSPPPTPPRPTSTLLPPPAETPTVPPPPGQLPATGANANQGLEWLGIGLVSIIAGISMLGTGRVLLCTDPRSSGVSLSQEKRGRLSDTP